TVLLLVVSTSMPSPGATRYVQARGVYLMPMPYHHGKRTRLTRAMSARAIRFLQKPGPKCQRSSCPETSTVIQYTIQCTNATRAKIGAMAANRLRCGPVKKNGRESKTVNTMKEATVGRLICR